MGWAERAWHPTTGCSPISEGCRNCVARGCMNGNRDLFAPGFKPTVWEKELYDPLFEQEGRLVLVSSLGDLFHRDIPEEFIRRVLKVMQEANQHDYFLLTKRPSRMKEILKRFEDWPLPYVSIGTSAENQKWLDIRASHLVDIPVGRDAVRYLSCEPMLGPISIARYNHKIGWVIYGAERASKPRPAKESWFEQLRVECRSYGIPTHGHRSENVGDLQYPHEDQQRLAHQAVSLTRVVAHRQRRRKRLR